MLIKKLKKRLNSIKRFVYGDKLIVLYKKIIG